jgi:hypothetical protein
MTAWTRRIATVRWYIYTYKKYIYIYIIYIYIIYIYIYIYKIYIYCRKAKREIALPQHIYRNIPNSCLRNQSTFPPGLDTPCHLTQLSYIKLWLTLRIEGLIWKKLNLNYVFFKNWPPRQLQMSGCSYEVFSLHGYFRSFLYINEILNRRNIGDIAPQKRDRYEMVARIDTEYEDETELSRDETEYKGEKYANWLWKNRQLRQIGSVYSDRNCPVSTDKYYLISDRIAMGREKMSNKLQFHIKKYQTRLVSSISGIYHDPLHDRASFLL